MVDATPRAAGVPAELRVQMPRRDARPSRGDLVVDLRRAASAPSVDAEPVRAGLLLVQQSLETSGDAGAVPPGQPFLLTESGEWRRFDLQQYGFGPTVYGELSTTISADGRHVAFADPSGLVTVDLRRGSFRRFDLPVSEAILLEHSADSTELLLKDRHDRRRPCGPSGCVLDLSTGRLTAVRFDLFYATSGDGGVVHELAVPTKGLTGRVVTYRDGVSVRWVALQHPTTVSTAGGPVAARDLAYAQCPRAGRAGEHGVVVVDPRSGGLVSALGAERGRSCRLGARAWLTDRHLLVDDWVHGDLWLWDVASGRLEQVAVGRSRGVHVRVAGEVLAHRLGLR